MDYKALADFLMSQGLVDPALFHGRRQNMSPVPPQATPAPEREERLEPMAPVDPVTPPLPTRKPPMVYGSDVDRTQGYIPAGGFGATGPQSGTELERRIYGGPPENQFNPAANKASGLWDAISRGMQFEPQQEIQGVPQKSGLDQGIEQALMLGLPLGRIGAGVGAVRAGLSAAARTVPQAGARGAAAGVRNYGKTGPWGTKTELQQTLQQQLRQIHRRAKAGKPDLLEGEALARRRALYADPSRRARYELARKGQLDEKASELLGLGRKMSYWR